MTTTPPLPQLTPAELAVMRILWNRGARSAREIHDSVGTVQGWAYSTTRTTVERMVRKGLVTKKSFHGLHVYAAAISRATGMARLIRDFATQVLQSGPVPVLSFVAESGALTDDEIDELRSLLDEPELAP